MPESRKRISKKNRRSSKQNGQRRQPRVDLQAPWKPSWWVLWGFITVVCELILIFLTKGKVVTPSPLRTAAIAVCIPFVAHLLVSGVRRLLFVSSLR
ncbi:MAG TPA: hypothetical protein VMJ64_02325 [Anaerolineales bacterium]|nr:hypothetical protein [Anaerolineales bacterium]